MRVENSLRAAGDSHPGLQRTENEDRFHYDSARGIFLVVDGVGGHAAGEQAADTAVAMLRARLERETGPVDDRIREAITIANNEIHRRASLRPEWKGMGCVLTVAVVNNGGVTVGHVGDTRLYKLRRGEIVKVTRDHSPVGEREDAREISEAEAMRHPRRNEVYRDVGAEPHETTDADFIDIQHVPFESDSALLLCSDGLTDTVASSTIGQVVGARAGHPHEIVRALIDAANDAGGKDNVTVVYVEGERFAATAVPPASLRPPTPAPVAPVAPATPDYRSEPEPKRAKRWLTALLTLLLFGVAAAAVWRLGPKVPWRFTPSVPTILSSRTVVVTPAESISDAIARAGAGTEVIVEPGEYRERLRLQSGVRVRSRIPHAASVRLPGGATEADAAIIATDVTDAEVFGLKVVGDSATPLGVGLFVRNSTVLLADLEITGAHVTAIEIVGGPGTTIMAAHVYDNPGAGLTVRVGAAPRIVHSQFVRNGMSDRAAGAIVIDAGAKPVLFGNVFQGVLADSLTGLTPAERATAKASNWFVPSDEGYRASNRTSVREGPLMTTVFNRLGPYEIVQPIGSGGMAQVFLALDTRTEQRVALRLVPIGRDREAKEILDAERWGARLQQEFSSVCPLLPRVYEHGELPDYFYVSMEYLDGENLSDVISRGRIQQERAVAIAMELCGFLEAAHSFEVTVEGRPLRSLLHGDLKPRNVRVTSSGRIKVLDFGMAKALSLSRKVTRTDFGTLGYMSPERLETGEMDAQSDCWALGVILYQMVSGTPPFAAPDTRRLERLIVSRRPPPSLEAFCLPGLQAIVAKLLAGDPEQRYPHATAVREDLARHQSGEETQAQKDGWPARLDEPPTQRTRPLQEVADEATRRTRVDPPAPAHAPEPPPLPKAAEVATAQAVPVVPAPPAPAVAPRKRRRLRTVLMILALFLIINEMRVGNAAGRLAAAAVTRELDQIDDLWTEYDRLADRSYLGVGISALEQALTERTQELADRVIYNYRTPEPTVREAQWDAARNALRRALMAAPRNGRIKAAMRYCDGHLHRINGEARKARRQLGPAQEEFTDAVTAFREAAELRSDWPDPFLGLMRVFIYGLEDIDRGADALHQAQRLGFNAGRRETTQLADGYRTRGETLMRTARTLQGVPQETEYLQRAAESLREALTLYGRVPGSDGVATSLRRTHLALERIELRLAELAHPNAENPDKPERQPSTVAPATPGSHPPGQTGERVGASPAWP